MTLLQDLGATGFGAVVGALVAWRSCVIHAGTVQAKVRFALWGLLMAAAAALATTGFDGAAGLPWLAFSASGTFLSASAFAAALRYRHR